MADDSAASGAGADRPKNVGAEPHTSDASASRPRPDPFPRKRTLPLWAGALLGLIALALVALLFRRLVDSADDAGWRRVEFPTGISLGALSVVSPPEFLTFPSDMRWEFGRAQGAVAVPPRCGLSLTVDKAVGLKPLADLPPDAIDRLILNRKPLSAEDLRSLSALTAVREIQMADIDLSGQSLDSLGECAALERLILRRTRIEDAGIASLGGTAKLRALDLHGTQITDASIPVLARLANLQTLDLTDTSVTREGIAELRRALPGATVHAPLFFPMDEGGVAVDGTDPAPVEIDFESLSRMSEEETASIAALTIRDDEAVEGALGRLASSASLESLTLRAPIGDAELEHLSALTRLRRLDLRGTRVTEAGLAHLAELSELEELQLDFKLGDVGAEALARLGPACVLPLLDPLRMRDGGLRYVKLHPSIVHLSLDGAALTPEDLVSLGEMTQLHALRLQLVASLTDDMAAHLAGLTNLVALDLSATPIGDDGLKHLKGMQRLQMLGLASTKITDRAMQHLKDLRSLRVLDVQRCELKPETLAELQEALPDCQILPAPPAQSPPGARGGRPIG